MSRSFLRWFYLAVQFVMLAVSIPKVATLFHAYDAEALGPLLGGVDIRSWLVGLAIDLTATFTTWAAMAKYDESRQRSALVAPGLIILLCTSLSVVANYEAAATLAPAQYAHIDLFSQPALFVNPILISAPPVLVLLLILLVPSVLARPRIRSTEEIAAEAAQHEAQIEAEARIREARARANARVRGVQLGGLADNLSTVVKRTGLAPDAPPSDTEARTEEPNERASDPAGDAPSASETQRLLEAPSAHVSRAMWNSLNLKERVLKSGVIAPQEVAEVLGVSVAYARKLVKEVRVPDGAQRTMRGRSGVPYQLLIDTLYARRTRASLEQAQKLEAALGLRRRPRALQPVPDDDAPPEEEDVS